MVRAASHPTVVLALVVATGLFAGAPAVHGDPKPLPRPVKVLLLAPSDADAQGWIGHYGLTEKVAVPGLAAADPAVLCNSDDVCELTTGIGKANAAVSVSEVIYSGQLDLSRAWFLLASSAAINPEHGTVGSAAWAGYAVDFAISWEVDARSLPSGWNTGYLGIGSTSPTQKPVNPFGSEVYPLAQGLLKKAVLLSGSAKLSDNPAAQALRAHYATGPATQAPQVIQCDAMSGDTAWGGALLGARATAWTSIMTGGAGTYCTFRQEDNAVLTALSRGASAGLLDLTRAAVVHAGSAFDRPYSGQSAFDALTTTDASIASLAQANVVVAGSPLVDDIVMRWSEWQKGVPQ